MNRKAAITLALLLAAVVIWQLWQPASRQAPVPAIPSIFTASIPPACRQLVLVLAPGIESTNARLWMLQRADAAENWRLHRGPIPVTLGSNGLGWGLGEHTGQAPSGMPAKREGDRRSPAGVFRIPLAFGQSAASAASFVRLPYIPLSPTVVGVEDPASRFYNQIIDKSQVAFDSSDDAPMQRQGDLYRWGAFVGHNPARVPGLGSCILLHLWPEPGDSTAGCTAMAGSDLEELLRWLDPAQEPRLVQGLESW